jgi:hypothetical protein
MEGKPKGWLSFRLRICNVMARRVMSRRRSTEIDGAHARFPRLSVVRRDI